MGDSETSGNKRFIDDGRQLVDFAHEFLIACPECSHRCKVQIKSGEVNHWSSPRVVTCSHCGLIKETREKKYTVYDDGRDWYFGYQLWLQTPCCGDTLWVLNPAHLEYLESFFNAQVREQIAHHLAPPGVGYRNVNRSLISRLPKWMKERSNQPKILKALEKLRSKLV